MKFLVEFLVMRMRCVEVFKMFFMVGPDCSYNAKLTQMTEPVHEKIDV